MNPRHGNILATLVELYVEDGKPVSSGKLSQLSGLGLSSATVRKVLAELEKDGYLTQPHTSSGRIPTDKAYRAYVDRLAERLRPDERFRDLFKDRVVRELQDTSDLLQAVSSFLSDLTDHLGIIVRLRSAALSIVGLRLVSLEGGRLLVVVSFEPPREHVAVLRLREMYSPEVLSLAESHLNEKLAGRSVAEARLILGEGMQSVPGKEGELAREVSRQREALFEEDGGIDYALEGAEKVLDDPGIVDPVSLRPFLSILGRKERLAERLKRMTEQETGLHIRIGTEIPWNEFRSFSLITSSCVVGDSRGLIGVVGPTRMKYPSIISLVHMVAEEVDRVAT